VRILALATVTVRLDSGRLVSGKPGDIFDMPLGDGGHRPRLVSASHRKGEATFRCVVH